MGSQSRQHLDARHGGPPLFYKSNKKKTRKAHEHGPNVCQGAEKLSSFCCRSTPFKALPRTVRSHCSPIFMQHSGGTVCSPTRATVLTGRNHFRDCVDYVYGCSDMTECVPSFNFAPENTFTVGDAVRAGGKGQYAR